MLDFMLRISASLEEMGMPEEADAVFEVSKRLAVLDNAQWDALTGKLDDLLSTRDRKGPEFSDESAYSKPRCRDCGKPVDLPGSDSPYHVPNIGPNDAVCPDCINGIFSGQSGINEPPDRRKIRDYRSQMTDYS